MNSSVAAGGLLLDCAGAVVLAMAFMTKKETEALRETAMYVGRNPFLFISLAKQKADAWVGATLLIAGFLAQFAASVMDDEPDWLCLPVAIAGAVALAVLAAVLLRFVVRPFFVGRAVAVALESAWIEYQGEHYTREAGKSERHWWWAVEGWGQRMGRPRRDDEDLQDYGRRLLGRRWSGVGADKPAPPADYESLPDDEG